VPSDLRPDSTGESALRFSVLGSFRVDRDSVDPGSPWREPQRIVVESCMMLLTGTLADHAEQLAARVAQPDHQSVPHLAAPAAALGFTLRGDLEQARQITSRWFAPSPWSWARVGSQIWINRTKDLIGRITAAARAGGN
jgi:hypothetical protein